jgi:hypothetical protein
MEISRTADELRPLIGCIEEVVRQVEGFIARWAGRFGNNGFGRE